MTPQQAFHLAIDQYSAGDLTRLGVAVSGGSDSMALLWLALDYARSNQISLHVATVDHGLRPKAADEARFVAAFCADHAVDHQTLVLDVDASRGNLQAVARDGRYRLLTDWAEKLGLHAVLLGHTRDDQAETVLMRLARGSGVDGLAGMRSAKDGLFLRPLLNVSRATLRDMLTDNDISWVEDPSNTNDRFDRVKVRQMLPELARFGLTTERLVACAEHMQRAQTALHAKAQAEALTFVQQVGPDLLISKSYLQQTWDDTQPRILAAAIKWINGAAYKPRFDGLINMATAVCAGDIRTLGGVRMAPEKDSVRFHREKQACSDPKDLNTTDLSVVWDHRWLITADQPLQKVYTVKALGLAIQHVPDWRVGGMPFLSAQATPAVFDGATLIAAPALGYRNGFSARIVADFHSSTVFH